MTTTFLPQWTLGKARRGILELPSGKTIQTPCFAPVATRGAIKGALTTDLPTDGVDLILANTYHLLLRPGADGVQALGGLHAMLHWNGAILTDSGGFQVFSLGSIRELSDEGVTFRSHIDGAPLKLTPEIVISAQETFGSDIAMVLDVCPPLPCSNAELKRAVELSLAWAARSLPARKNAKMAMFGIVQGGTDIDMRRWSAEHTVRLGFDGYAIGGLSVGESAAELYQTLDATVPHLPQHQIRYLMGVGRPDNIVEAVARGIDLFDCVLPTRNARNGKLMTFAGFVNVQRAEFAKLNRPLDDTCPCPTCRDYSIGMLRYLYKLNELNYFRLATVHNLWFMADLMKKIRVAIEVGTFDELRKHIVACYAANT